MENQTVGLKAAIVTLSGYYNLGNRLQNYALQEILKSLGIGVTSLFDSRFVTASCIPKLKEFSKQYLKEEFYTVGKDSAWAEYNNRYTHFVVGSDQVWNPAFQIVASALPLFFLQFAPPEKRIAYSASFGIDTIPEAFRARFAEGLLDMKAISVREEAGVNIVRNLTAREVPALVDPTLLLSAAEWLSIRKSHSKKPGRKYIVTNFLSGADKTTNNWIQRIALSNRMEIIDINRLLMTNEVGPCEFLDYIKDADLVCTDSFHSTVFSIIMNTPFVYCPGVRTNMISRIDTLLKKFHFEERYQNKVSMDDLFQTDFGQVEQIQKEEKEKSIAFLKKAFGLKEANREWITASEKCTGCGACMQKCPVGAIQMRSDAEGFLYLEIDEQKCTKCGLCQRICHINQKQKLCQEKTKAYAVICKKDEIRKESSSGGMFSVLAEYVLRQEGVVFGAAFGEHFEVEHTCIEKIEELYKFRGSKYVQSKTANCYRQAEKYLMQGRLVLFTGTACQIAGLHSCLGKAYDNLYCVDIVCHGVPSPLAWQQYVTYREKVAGAPMVEFAFRDKSQKWDPPGVRAFYANGEKYQAKLVEDPFTQDFLRENSLRPSCSNCKYKTVARQADFTLADFWGIDHILPAMNDNKGTSLVFLHNERAERIFSELKAQLKYSVVKEEEAVKYNPSMIHSWPAGPKRAAYFEAVERSAACSEMLS